MKKVFLLQLTIIMLGIQTTTLLAQDSAKKVKPGKPAPAANVVTVGAKYTKYKYKSKPGYYYVQNQPAKAGAVNTHAPAITATQPVATKPDTTVAKVAVTPAAPIDKSLNAQYQYLLSKVYAYQQPLIGAFHTIVMDTLNQAKRDLRSTQAQLSAQTKTIDSLQNAAKAEGQTLSESTGKVNEIDLLGMPMDKSTYNLIMWGLVIVFGAIAGIVIARSGAAAREAKYRTQLYNELDEEYKAYKAKANEKEKKLARELQTERNRLDDLLGNPEKPNN